MPSFPITSYIYYIGLCCALKADLVNQKVRLFTTENMGASTHDKLLTFFLDAYIGYVYSQMSYVKANQFHSLQTVK